MSTSTISKLNTVGVTRKLYKAVSVVYGTPLTLTVEKAEAKNDTRSHVERLRGLGKEIWKSAGGADKYLQSERNSWDK